MKWRCFLWFLVLIVLFWPTGLYGQQEVRIRVISAKDKQPLKGQPISVSLLYEKPEKAPAKLDLHPHTKTDINGEALVSIPEPAPEHLGVVVHLTSGNWRCACLALADTGDVIHSGITVPDTAHKSESAAPSRPKPREIVFVARPLTFFERILEPLLKQ